MKIVSLFTPLLLSILFFTSPHAHADGTALNPKMIGNWYWGSTCDNFDAPDEEGNLSSTTYFSINAAKEFRITAVGYTQKNCMVPDKNTVHSKIVEAEISVCSDTEIEIRITEIAMFLGAENAAMLNLLSPKPSGFVYKGVLTGDKTLELTLLSMLAKNADGQVVSGDQYQGAMEPVLHLVRP